MAGNLPCLLAVLLFPATAFAADGATPPPSPTPTAEAKKPAITLADLLSASDEELVGVDPAGMYLLAYQGFSYGKNPIDYAKGEAEIDSLASFYQTAGLGASSGGDEADRQRFLMLCHEFQSQPPEHCPIPAAAFMVSIGRRLGYPVGYANTAKGIQIYMRDPSGQDCFVDLNSTDAKDAQWWRIAEEVPYPKTNVEQIGKMPGEKPPMLHWVFQPRDILGLALVERAQRLKVGNLSAYVEGKEDELCIENADGKFSMKPEQWEHATLLSLVAFLQAQSVSDRADLRRWISVASKVSGMGWRSLIVFADLLGTGGSVSPKIHPVDKKTPAIRNLILEKLLEKEPDQLGGIDIALMDLACADELPDSGKIDIPTSLATLDQWAEIVRQRIEANEGLFYDNPKKFDYSKNKFKAAMLVLTLQADLGIHYNKDVAAMTDPDVMAKKYPGSKPDDTALQLMELARTNAGGSSKDQFITGILSKERSGTCASLPVLYAAVGRRLGFPLKLATVPGHVFVRWDSKEETFNIEGTNGFSIHDDDHYRHWPTRIFPPEEEEKGYIKSLSPADELAMFLRQRARCLEDKGRIVEAMLSQAQSCRYRNLRTDRHRLVAQDALINNEYYYGK